MATGYGEFARELRQGSLNPQQWAAYLRQQSQMRTAYKQAFSELQAAAQREGLNIAPPELRSDISQAEAQAKLQEYAKQINKDLSYFDVDVQLNTIYKDAAASGLNVPKPTSYGKTVKNAATAKLIIDNYIKKVDQVALQKNLTDVIDDIRSQAAQQGVILSRIPQNAFVGLTEAKAQSLIDNYLKNANYQIAVKNYNDAVNSISAQAKAQGVTVAPPAKGITTANVQAMIDRYAASVNNALLQKSVSDAIDSIYAQAKGYGVEVPKPSVTGITEANAQTFVDNYLNKVNNALANQPVSVSQVATPVSANERRDPVGPGGTKPDGKVHGTGLVPVKPGETTLSRPKYIVRDDLGREVTITESQLQQMQKAQQNKTWRENYTVVPEEVANSKANWWINSQGLYEWVPVTEADKKKLAERNAYYSRFGQKPRTTLTCGASPSAEYSKEWYSTGGKKTLAKVGSGDLKLQKMKAGSSVNVHASAKTGTAQQAKAINVQALALANPDKLYDKFGKEIQRIEYSKDAKTSTGSVKIYASKEDLKQARIDAAKVIKEAEAIRKAYVPVEVSKGIFADPIQMKGGVAGTGESKVTIQKREVIKNKKGEIADIKVLAKSGTAKEYAEALKAAKASGIAALTDLGLSGMLRKDPKTGQVVLVAEQGSIEGVQEFKTVDQIARDAAVARAVEEARKINPKGSEEYFAGVANVARRSQMSTKEILKEDWNRYEKSIAKVVSSILPDLDTIAKTRDKYLASVTVTVKQPGKKTRQYTLKDVQRKHQKAVKENVVTAGLLKFTEDEYTRLRTKPLTYAAETGAIMAGGAVVGAGAGGLKAVVSPGFAKVAAKTGSKPVKAVSSFAAKHGVDAVVVGLPLAYTAGSGVKYFTSSDYKNLSAIDKDAAQVQFVAGIFKMGKDMAIGYPGFAKGSKVGVKVTEAAIPKVSQGVKSTKIGIKEMLKDEKALVQVKRETPQKMQPVGAYQQRTKTVDVPDMLVDSGKGLQVVSPKIEKVVSKVEMDFDALMRMSDEEFNFLYQAMKNPETVTIKKGQILARTEDLAMFENTLKLSELKSSVRARDRAKMIQLRRILDGVTPSLKFQKELKNISLSRGKNYITARTDPKGGASKISASGIRVDRNTKTSNRRLPTNEVSEITRDIEKVKGTIIEVQKQSPRTVPRTFLTHKPVETQKNTPRIIPKTSQIDKQTTPNIYKSDLRGILDEIGKLDTINGGSSGGSGGFGGVRPPHKPGSETPIIVGRRSRKTPANINRDSARVLKLQRKIQNAFGNLETMFGSSTARPVKKTVKKSVKRVKKA